MKKLVTAFALCAAMSAMAQTVESENIVGYKTEGINGTARVLTVKFQKVGGGITGLTDILDGATVVQYSDLLQVYDPATGFTDYQWDGTTWFDTTTWDPIIFDVIPGNGFLVLAEAEWTTAGEVASITSYVHPITPATATLVGNAFPAATTLGNFNWDSVATYSDLLQMYDPAFGFIDYQFDGTNWFDTTTWDTIPMTTPITDGFLFLSDLSSITQYLTPYYL